MAIVEINTANLQVGLDRIVMLSMRSIDFLWTTAETAIKEKYLKPMEVNISLTDHTQKQLNKLDHPYAKRHGSIQSSSLGHEPWLVHKQHGGLAPTIKLVAERSLSAVKADIVAQARVSSGGKAIFSPGAMGSLRLSWNVVSNSQITAYVEFGTDKMLPRDFAGATLKQHASEITDHIKSNFHMGGA